MTLRMCAVLASTTIAGLVSVPQTAAAQEGSVGVVAFSADHRLLSDGLLGAAARASFARGDGRRSLRFGVEHLTGAAHRTGVPCHGLIFPGTCPPEPLRDDARMTTFSGGLAFRVLTLPRVVVEAGGDLRLGWVRADTRGLESDTRLSADKALWGGEVGVEAAWSPSVRIPLALEIGAAAGGLRAVIPDGDADGYNAFDYTFSVTRLRVGLAWRRSSR